MPFFSYGGKLTFRTELTIAELIGKMIIYADKETGDFVFLLAYGPNEIVYNIEGNKFRLWRKPQYLNNRLMPFFYGKFLRNNDKTLITGNFGMHPIVGFISKLLLWAGLAFSAFFLFIYYSVTAGLAQVEGEMPFTLVLAPFVFSLIVAALLRFCVWIGEKDIVVITEFIINRLQAPLDT